MAINTTDLAASLGSFYRESNRPLSREIFLGFDSKDYMTVAQGKDQIPLVPVAMGNIVKPSAGTNAWAPTSNAIDFKPRILQLRRWKVDLELVPDVLYNRYPAYLLQRGGKDEMEPTFEQFLYDHIIGKAKENLENLVIYRGVYDAAGTGPAAVADGLLTLIAAEITATTITPVATGAVSSTNAVAAFEQVYRSLPAVLQDGETVAFCSYDLFNKYCDDFRTRYGASTVTTDTNGFRRARLEGTNCTIVPRVGMGTSQRIVITTKENVYLGMDLEPDFEEISFEPNRRGIDVMMDGKIGVQIERLDYLRVNNQA